MIRFIFDLDGTVSKEETLPLIASHFHIEEEIQSLTKATIAGNIPFIDSFIRRVHMLSHIPTSQVNALLQEVTLFPMLLDFFHEHREHCVIATGNLDCWVHGLLEKTTVQSYTSKATVENDYIQKITYILQKESIVKKYKEQGDTVVFIGEGNNDAEAMRIADISIATGLVHTPASSTLCVANYLVWEEGSLCRLLNQLF